MDKEKQIEEMTRALENHTCMSPYQTKISTKTQEIRNNYSLFFFIKLVDFFLIMCYNMSVKKINKKK